MNYLYYCNSCDYKCNVKSSWEKHLLTTLHITGKRKVRTDKIDPYTCKNCSFKTKNKVALKQHNLNYHSTITERENEFKFYCKYCDFGTFSNPLYEEHLNTEKHKIFIKNLFELKNK